MNETKEINKALNKEIGLEGALEPNTIKTEQSVRMLKKRAVNEDLSEAMDELQAVQVKYQLVLTSTEERRKVRHNLQCLLEMMDLHM